MISQYFDKILFAIASTYLVVALLWLVSSGKLKSAFVSTFQKPSVAQNQSLSPADAKFIVYLQQSLAAIERQAEQQKIPLPSPSPVKVPPAPVPNNTPVATRNTPTAIERIYVPVYPPNPPSPSPAPKASAPLSSVPVLAPSANLLPAPTASYTLNGLLESGDRSYALFQKNGVTQQVKLGEEIGTSGWRLASVANQKALISRRGERRYIEVGQQF